MRILIADDRAENRYLLEQILQSAGHSVTSTADGAAFLDEARRQRYDLFVSDILMPGMDGFALCRALKSDPTLASVPFVFYTATYTDPKDEQFALSLGADRFLVKPVEPDTLIAIVEELGAAPARRAAARTESGSETVFLQQYNRTLIEKLESKMLELEKTHAALAESERKFREIFEHSSDCIFLVRVSPDGGFAYEDINHAEELCTGTLADSVRGRTPEDVLGPEAAEAAKARYRACLLAKRPVSFEQSTRSQGAERIYHTLLVPIADADGHTYRIAGFSRDITDERAAAAARDRLERELADARRLEALGQLAGTIAHDFNNILMAIQGNAELLKPSIAKLGDATSQESLGDLLAAVRRGRDLVAQILAHCRRTPAQRRPIDLAGVVQETLRAIRTTLPPNVTVDARIPATTALVLADESRIHQLALNLCTNAVQAMPEGGTLRVSLEVRDVDALGKRGRCVRLSVADTGHGIDPAVRDRIFDPLVSTKGPGKGTGLGLTAVRDIARDHHAAITVESAPGDGATFRVHFPIVALTGAATSSSGTSPLEAPAPRGNGESILVIDDDPAVLAVVTSMLRDLQYAPSPHERSETALAAILERPSQWSLAIVDLEMPRMRGPELVALVRTIAPRLPILLLSGADEPESIPGVSGTLRKPIDLDALGHAVAAVRMRSSPR
ncbi:MAG: response regulator [Phycisphaerae bacterium]|nr:response regulator [Phycisphaerae bacterium]